MFWIIYDYIYLFLAEYVFCNPIRLTLLTLTSIFGTWLFRNQMDYYKKLPPGPFGLPVLGRLPWMSGESPHKYYRYLNSKYGDITSVQLGLNLVVCIGSASMLRDVFNRLDSTGRPKTPLNTLLDGLGIVLSENLLWRRQRHFLHDKFRALGVSLWKHQRLEHIIMGEIDELLINIEKLGDKPMDPVVVFGRHLHNVICMLTMSYRFEEGDEEFLVFNERVARAMRLYGSVHIGEHLPIYLALPGKKAVINEIGRNLKEVSEFHERRVNQRIAARNAESGTYEFNDLLDYYLEQLDKEKEGKLPSIFHDVDPKKQIVQVMNDLFSSGMETSRNSLVWLLAIMLKEPIVAARVKDELAGVVGVCNTVTMTHRTRLPYTEAVIYESLRRTSVVPLGTTHVNTDDWVINGLLIPAGSHIVPLINKINMDPQLFDEPEKFLPERFLKNGKLHLPEYFIPFGVGRRICLGIHLARIELFLFFTNIMNNYSFTIAKGEEVPGWEGHVGITHAASPFTLVFTKLKAE